MAFSVAVVMWTAAFFNSFGIVSGPPLAIPNNRASSDVYFAPIEYIIYSQFVTKRTWRQLLFPFNIRLVFTQHAAGMDYQPLRASIEI